MTTKVLDGATITDVFAEDLTIAELKMLRLNQKTVAPAVNRTHQYDGECPGRHLKQPMAVSPANAPVGLPIAS